MRRDLQSTKMSADNEAQSPALAPERISADTSEDSPTAAAAVTSSLLKSDDVTGHSLLVMLVQTLRYKPVFLCFSVF